MLVFVVLSIPCHIISRKIFTMIVLKMFNIWGKVAL